MRAELDITLERGRDGGVRVGGALAVPPLWCRWDGATLWMVGSAASPVADDEVDVRLRVGPGVDATVRSVAALIAYTAARSGTSLVVHLEVAPGATLHWAPEPMIVSRRARHRSTINVATCGDGAAVVDDLVVLGRTGETPGSLSSTLELSSDGVPALLTSWDTDQDGWAGPGGVAGAKVVGTRLVAAGADRQRVVEPPDGDRSMAVLRSESGAALAVALGDRVHDVAATLDHSLRLRRESTLTHPSSS